MEAQNQMNKSPFSTKALAATFLDRIRCVQMIKSCADKFGNQADNFHKKMSSLENVSSHLLFAINNHS